MIGRREERGVSQARLFGLAVVVLIFRNRSSANVDELDLMKW